MTANLTITMSHGLYLLIALSRYFFLSLTLSREKKKTISSTRLRYSFRFSLTFRVSPVIQLSTIAITFQQF